MQEAAATKLTTRAASGNFSHATANMAQRSSYQRRSSASAAGGATATETGVAIREPIELDSSLISRSAFSLSADDRIPMSSPSTTAAKMTMTNVATDRSRRRQQRSRRQSSHRPASAGSLRAAVSSWGEHRGRGVGLTQLTRGRSSAGVRAGGGGSKVTTSTSAWAWEDNLRTLQQQSSRYAGADITLD